VNSVCTTHLSACVFAYVHIAQHIRFNFIDKVDKTKLRQYKMERHKL